MRSNSTRHSPHSFKCAAIASRAFISPSRYRNNSSSVMCFMIPFPLPWPFRVLARTVSALAATSVLRETPCFLSRLYLISAPPRFPRFHNHPSAALRSPYAPRDLTRPMLLSSFLPARRSWLVSPVKPRNRSLGSADRFTFHFLPISLELPPATPHSFSAAAGQWRSSPQSGKPTSQNWRCPQTAAISGTPARMLPAQFPRRRVNFRSCDMPRGKRRCCAARRAHDRHRALQQVSSQLRPRRSFRQRQPFRCSLAFSRLDRFFPSRLGRRPWPGGRHSNGGRP